MEPAQTQQTPAAETPADLLKFFIHDASIKGISEFKHLLQQRVVKSERSKQLRDHFIQYGLPLMKSKDAKEYAKVVRAYSRCYRNKTIPVEEFAKQMSAYISGAPLPETENAEPKQEPQVAPQKPRATKQVKVRAPAEASDSEDDADGEDVDDDELIVNTLTDILSIIKQKRGRNLKQRKLKTIQESDAETSDDDE